MLCVLGRDKLGRAKSITKFCKYYPNMAQILIDQYDMEEEEKIQIIEARTVDRFMGFKKKADGDLKEVYYRNYRPKFKQIYYGTVKDLKPFIRKYLKKHVWKKRKKKDGAKKE